MASSINSLKAQLGQAMTDWVLIIGAVALSAMLGFSLLGAGMGTQSSALAESLTGGAPRAEQAFRQAVERSAPNLVNFETVTAAKANPDPSEADPTEQEGTYAFFEGVAAGFIDNLLSELTALLNPFDTALALAELVRLLATDLVATTKALVDELVVGQVDKLINGTSYEKGFVIGNQISATKALSALAKVSGAAALVAPARRLNQDAPGTAIVRQHEGGHFSVEVRQGGDSVLTHQVVTSGDYSTTRILTDGQHPTGVTTGQGTIDLPNARGSRNRQGELQGIDDLGPYDSITNSCVSHVCDVLGAGGADVPAVGGSAQSRFLLRLTKEKP